MSPDEMSGSAPQRAQRVFRRNAGLITPGGHKWMRALDAHEYSAFFAGRSHSAKVRYCGTTSRWGNPFEVRQQNVLTPHKTWYAVYQGERRHGSTFTTKDAASRFAVECFRAVTRSCPDDYFTDLLGYDLLSCWCTLGAPCHVDEIVRAGAERGIW